MQWAIWGLPIESLRMSILRIRRANQYADRLRSYSIMLDGIKVGEVKNGETQELPISPGQHQLRMKIDWCGSNSIQFATTSENDVLTFSARSSFTGLAIFAVLYYMIFQPNAWIILERES